jgi:hypothetical protein
VHHGGDVRVVVEDPVDDRRVGDVALVEGAALAELPAPGDQVVQDDRLMATIEKAGRNRAADESRTAGDEHLHEADTFRDRLSDRRQPPHESNGHPVAAPNRRASSEPDIERSSERGRVAAHS